MSDNEVQVKITATSDGVEGPIDSAKEQISSLGESVDSIKESFEGLAEIIGEGFAVEKIIEFSESMAQMGAQIEHTAAITGQSTDQVQQFQNLVRGTGGSVDTANLALTRLNRNISEAASGALPQAADAFQRLRVSQQELERGNLNEIMETMAKTLHDTADGANKTQAMYAAVGRSGAQLIPIFDLGVQGMREWNDAVKATGANIGEDLSEKLERLDQAMVLNKDAAQGIANAFMSALLPSINAAVTGVTQMREEFSQSINQGGILRDLISGLGNVMLGTVAAVMTLKDTFIGLWDIAVGVFTAMGDSAVGFGTLLSDLAHGQIQSAFADWVKWQTQATDDFKKGFKEAGDEARKLAGDIKEMMAVQAGDQKVGIGSGRGNPKNPFAPPAAQDNKKPNDDETQKRAGYAETYDVKKEYDDLQVHSGKMSHDAEYADLQTQLAKEYDAIDASFTREMALYDAGSQKYEQLKEEQTNANLKYLAASEKLTQEATKEEQKDWTDAINTIDKTFDSMLSGVLQGTQTIQQAFQRMAANMIISFAEAIAKMLVQWAAFEASTAANGNKAGLSNPFGGGGGSSGQSGGLMALLIAGLGLNTTATTANTAANYVAATASDQVAADVAAEGATGGGGGIGGIGGILGSLASFIPLANGAWNVQEGLYHLHNDEMVVPKPYAEAVRSGEGGFAGGGGGDTHLHVHAMDTKGVKQFFNQHGSSIARVLGNQARSGNRSFMSHA